MSTHPVGGGGTGPGRLNLAAQFAAFMDFDGRRVRSLAAETAGSYGRSAAPLAAERRVDNYRRQTNRAALTPAQRRRAVRKARTEAARQLASVGFTTRA